MRRVIEKTEGQLGRIFVEAMCAWDAMKADGVPLLERVKALEAILRQAWPFTREWKFLCHQCGDTGLVMAFCAGDSTCGDPPPGSTTKTRRIPHLPHDFGRPCWCSLGARFKPPVRNTEDFEAAGRMPKAKPFSRVGR